MKWNKLGKIFDPADYHLPNNCTQYAQSPQTIVFDDFVRIYFSTRQRDSIGKFLSHVAYVDFDKDFKNVIEVSKSTVIELGSLGSFDEHGIFPINVLKTADKILAFTTGWNRRVSVSADASVGLAISEDNGKTFIKVGKGPVLTCALNEPFLVCDAFVLQIENVYHMWYIFGTKWISDPSSYEPQRVYKIAHATSVDGINWRRNSQPIISDKLNQDECQALPTVIFLNGMYHMIFCYREAVGFRDNREKSYRLGYAYSSDLLNWIRDDEKVGIEVSESGWDCDMQCYPHIFECNGQIYLLYNGNEFGRFGFGLAVLEQF